METGNKERKITLIGYIRWLYLTAKVRWADWMAMHSQRLGRKGLLIAFGLFTSSFSGLCLVLIFSGGTLFYKEQPVRPEAITTIRAPDAPVTRNALPDTLLLNQLKAFRRYMDALGATENGRKTRDSLLGARPGLMDSVRLAESIYTNNKDEHYEK